MKKLFFVCFISIGFISQVYAGVIADLFLGGNIESQIVNNDNDDELKVSGLLYGGKIGYSHLGFGIGFDYRLGTFETNLDGDAQEDLSFQETSLFLQYSSPFRLTFWLRRTLSTNIVYKSDPENKYLIDPMLTLGVGYKVGNNISINYERSSGAISEVDVSGSKSDVDYDATFNFITISYSFL